MIIENKRQLVATFTIEDGLVKLTRSSNRFPVADFPACIDLLQKNLDEEARRVADKKAVNDFATTT